MSKQQRRADILSKIDGKLGMVKVLQNEISDLVKTIDGEWVIRKRYVRDVKWFGGSISEGHIRYAATPPHTGQLSFVAASKVAGYVKMFKSPRDAVFVAECMAGRDSKFETQDKYVIEIVDRLDGEVFAVIEKPWRHKDVK